MDSFDKADNINALDFNKNSFNYFKFNLLTIPLLLMNST